MVVSLAASVAMAAAQTVDTPEEMIRNSYLWIGANEPGEEYSIELNTARGKRTQYFTPRLVELFDRSESYGGDLGCLDFSFIVDAQDFDENEIAATLDIRAETAGDRATVTARFTNFGQPNHFAFEFERSGGAWLVADIANLAASGWRLSTLDCPWPSGTALSQPGVAMAAQMRLLERGFDPGPADGVIGGRTRSALAAFAQRHGLPGGGELTTELIAALAASTALPADVASAAVPTAGGDVSSPGAYCYSSHNAELRLDVAGDQSSVSLESWGDGHFCGIGGRVTPVAGSAGRAWRYTEEFNGIPSCNLTIDITASGNVSFADREWGCKRIYCGARGDFESTAFTAAHRTEC